ncbi:MAG: TlpA disulfide reductase family protein [Acidimicrobiia bacterium]|jgi:cytochrome c biogenesis protein CcmG, thiol:disulfide interchange protein DsbE
MRTALAFLIAAAVGLVACSAGPEPGAIDRVDLPDVETEAFLAMLEGSDRPAVVNVWASWCLPCRSEAPLLAAAHRAWGEEVRFVGVAVQDDRSSAAAFVEEFGLGFEQWFDPGRRVPAALGGVGVPITYFVASDGTVVRIHSGIIDERSLALGIDELVGT